jgi:diguanylate cyclase (GGDEF)-like protein/PAS domain S-box-containing protein
MDGGHEAQMPGRASEDALDKPLLAPSVILEGLPDAVVAASRDGRIVFVNGQAEELFGYRREELLGRPVQVLWPKRVRARYVRNMELYFATEHPLRFTSEAWGVRRDGSEFVGEMSWGIVETSGGPLLLAIGRDISDRRAAEARLRAIAAMGERALAGADPVELADDAVELLCTSLPLRAATVRLSDGGILAATGEMSEPTLELAIGPGDELRVRCQRELTDEEMSVLRAVANTLATALARLRAEERMRHDALHDSLTGLANRVLLQDRLDHALARAVREDSTTAVLFLDLDNFKQVNDIYGHAAGDAVLAELGRRLRTTMRPADTVARIGGDEFVVVCEEVDEEAARSLGERLRDAIAEPFAVDGRLHTLTASIGVALGQRGGEALLARADAAVYRAKAAGGGRVEFFP